MNTLSIPAVMQPTGREVSAEAFSTHRRCGKLNASRSLVLSSLASGPRTRNQLAAITGLPLASICGRCRELLDLGLIDVKDTTTDKPARQILALSESGRALVLQAVESLKAKEGANDAAK
ncbi:MAG: hypothetical protein ACTID3_08500 [Halomonas sp.]|uniref:hypothetical protein n=1 Tax=Halomonas sp. TaxID=1486246 RepID=UPI003F9258C8